MANKKWIQKAVPASHKGRFTAWCKAQGFGGVNAKCIAAAKKSNNTHVVRMAVFAQRAQGGF